MAKDEDYKKLICSSRWKQIRRTFLSAHPLCQRCEAEGMVTPAREVHHIHPVECEITFREKEIAAYDLNNLMALCHDCHVKTHIEMGRCGKEMNIKRKSDQTKRIIERFFK